MKQNVKCPYMESGICYHKRCIYLPNLQCMKKAEYDAIVSSAKKYLKKKQKSVKHGKRG